jgi:predicted aminopeptidase
MISSKNPSATRTRRTRRRVGIGLGLAFFAFLSTTCNACYVARSGWFQAELLLSREPIDTVRASGDLNEDQLKKLDLIQDVKAFGGEIGLSATENYSRIAWDWKRTIWNVSACDPLNFRSESWWFPIVGRVPYLGFFRRKDADKWIRKLEKKGLDVYLRTAGAYSTLGYFEDPILPGMLEWEDDRLANTVLHEMVHATVWVKGSVNFNESLASFVGDSASLDYLTNRFGEDSTEMQDTQNRREDIEKWRHLQRALFGSLRAIYANPSLNETEKLNMKEQVFSQWPTRIATTDWHRSEGFVRAATEGVWNNARLMQFQAYNSYTSEFQRILDQAHGNYPEFLQRVNALVTGSSDPFEALSQAEDVQDF